MKDEYILTPEQERILANYHAKKKRTEEQEKQERQELKKRPRLSLKEMHERFGGHNWGIKTSKDEIVSDPAFSIEASYRLWKKEFEGHGYEAPSSRLAASISLRKLIEIQNEIRECNALLSD